MSRWIKIATMVAALAIVAAACGTGEEPASPTETQTPEGEGLFTPGGTLLLGMVGDVTAAFDPQKEYYSVSWEYYRCCLLRTLVSYKGVPAQEGGTELVPDLATDLPTVSEDGLTWTFTLKQGIMYAPPYEDTEITAGDFVRALERTQDPKASAGGYGFYYSGFTAEAPDDYTFTVTSETPTGDLDFRMAMPTMAPIPEGAADGHPKDYGRYLVASGPYMYEGAEQIDAANDVKATGYEPGRSLVLVRNPSWDAATDDIRDAYVDRIEVTIGGTEEELANKVDNDEIDMAFDVGATPEQIEAYTTTPELQDRFYNGTDDAVSYSSFNLGIPPFDDVHVRKAINWVINKDALRRIAGGPETGEIAGHIFVDGVIAARNSGYDPYATPNGQGDVEKAKAEMAQSKYDSNGDGVCDDPSCKNIFTVSEESSTNQKAVQRWQQDLQQIGITLDNRPLEIGPMYAKCNDPAEQVAFCPTVGWGKDYPDGYTFGPPLFGADGLFPGCCNYSLLGATPDQLKEWGYTEKYGITSVPSVDDQMNECASMTGDARIDCWAEVDKTLMEDIVPWVPRRFAKTPFATSTRVQNWIFDQFAGLPALDHIALANGGA